MKDGSSCGDFLRGGERGKKLSWKSEEKRNSDKSSRKFSRMSLCIMGLLLVSFFFFFCSLFLVGPWFEETSVMSHSKINSSYKGENIPQSSNNFLAVLHMRKRSLP